MAKYYIFENETKKGPLSIKEIIELDLSESTLVWKKGLKDWTELKNLTEYKKTIPPPIPKINPQDKIVPIENKDTENISSDNTTDIDIKMDIVKNDIVVSYHKNAGFWLRLVAFIIDFTLMFFITSFFWAIFQLPIPANSKSFFSGGLLIFKNPLGILFGWLYYAIFESSRFQATPGKAILGLKVTNENFESIGFGQASGRFFGKILSILIIGIGYLMIGLTKKRQGLHDILAHTFVLKENIKEIKRKPASWIIFIISFLFFVISLFIPANLTLIETMKSFNTNNLLSTNINNVQNVPFLYQCISFEYPDNWKVEKEELQQDFAYQISCEKEGTNSSEIITISWLNLEMDPLELIQNTIEGMKEEPSHKNSNFKPINATVFKGNDAFRADYDLELFGEKFYGRFISFNSCDKTVLIIKQADNLYKLELEFRVIENSLKIE